MISVSLTRAFRSAALYKHIKQGNTDIHLCPNATGMPKGLETKKASHIKQDASFSDSFLFKLFLKA